MKAFVTSINEPTTDLCIWSLERNGFEVVLLKRWDSLAEKLADIYSQADDDFVRVDADTVPNQNLTEPALRAAADDRLWWVQFLTYDWYKQDTTHGGVQFIKKEALPALRANIKDSLSLERPESQMYRLKEFHNPRRCDWNPCIMGITNYKNDMRRVREVKERRLQWDYDWELAEKLGKL